jgi:UDP-N-acetylmuramoylalanine--D-glutamate ligase
VLDATNDVVRERVRALKATAPEERGFAYIPLGTKAGIEGDMRKACGADNAAFLDAEGKLHIAFDGRDHVLCAAGDLQIKGTHNVSNALAASAAAVALGADDAAICEALKAFKPLEHRIEPCGTVRGVHCYNDSKATNVDATLKALAAFPETRPIVLLGGDDKGTDLSALVEAAHRHVRAVVCFGSAGERFERAFSDAASGAPADFQVVRAHGMESALDAALGLAQAGEVVLLSPACASFDEFSCFEERGDVFKRLVAERAHALGA